MLSIKKDHLDRFMQIKEQFLAKTKVPKENNWKSWTNDEIWLHIFEQVIVVGGSKPAEQFSKDAKLRNRVSYETLVKIREDDDLKREINYVLRSVGARYASSNISKCRKTDALAHNLKVLKSFDDGPKGLLKRLSELEGLYADKRKIRYLMRIFKYIKSKSARDFLMELGIVRDAVALDIRVQNIFAKIGVRIPKGFEADPKIYDEIEKDILEKVCKYLKMSGVEFDRMLYQNYKSIMSMNFS
jgi:hypothetical protein